MFFSNKNKLILITLATVLLLGHFAIFGSFIPNKNEQMGHDYSFYLPALLDGYFWYKTNGIWGIPWFTPSFCGGSLNSLNINNGYYTIPQFLTFLTDPLSAVRLTLFLFAGLGLFGFYLLLRNAFSASRHTALLGGGLFLFNGFYAHRMLIGHIFIHSFMLLPLITFFMLRPLPAGANARRTSIIFDITIGGFLFAYMVVSGISSFMIPSIISIVIIGLIHGLIFGNHLNFWLRLIGSGLAGVFLCASKLTAIFSLIKTFPRSAYKLPGAESFLTAAWLLLKSLFVSPAFDPARTNMLTNVQWLLERHEWEYSVTIIPLLIMLFAGWKIFRRMQLKDLVLKLNWKQYFQIGAIAALLVLPVAVNTYASGWNTFLKQLPLLKNSSSLIRWFIIYIPIVVLAATLILEKIALSSNYKLGIIVISMATVIALNALTERDFYHSQNYDPQGIIKTYNLVKEGLWKPEIKNIGVYLNKNGQTIMPLFRNDMLIHGASQLLCYEPLFGYRLEDFPIKTLHPGPAMAENKGVLNIKNPSCYVWPEANDCEPGDHFTVEQKESAKAFLNYRPFPFKMPILQRLANWVNGLSLIAALFFLTLSGARAVVAFSRKKKTH
jgi:hypothetical protein